MGLHAKRPCLGVLALVPLAGPGFWREMFKRDQLLFTVLWLCLTNIDMTPPPLEELETEPRATRVLGKPSATELYTQPKYCVLSYIKLHSKE